MPVVIASVAKQSIPLSLQEADINAMDIDTMDIDAATPDARQNVPMTISSSRRRFPAWRAETSFQTAYPIPTASV